MVRQNHFMYFIAALVSLGGILYGYDIGVISGALLFIKQTIPMSDSQVGLIVGAVLAGGLIGTLIAGPMGDNYGRRPLIMIACIVFMLGIIFVMLAHSFLIIFLARLLLGVGVGVIAVAVPLYVAEIVPSENRGKYMTMFQLLLTFGIVLAYVTDLLFTSSGNWRGMFAIVLMPASVLFAGMIFLPETPRWLIANNYLDKATQVLNRIRTSPDIVQEEILEIKRGLQETHGTWKELFSRAFWLPTMIAIAIAIFNQLTGINSFLQYAPLILKNAGMGSDTVAMLGSAGIGIINFCSTIISIALIDTLGRRPLLLTGVTGVMLSECYLGCVQLLDVTPFTTGILSLIGLFSFIVFFAIGPGVVVWLAISESFPTRLRGKGMSLCLFFNSLASTLLAIFFLPMSAAIGMAQTYWLFALFTLGYFLVVFLMLPETKTKSLEEIQLQFQARDH